MPPFQSSKIKDFYIEIQNDFEFYHGAADKSNPHFVGRIQERERIKLLIEKSASPSGAYLIAGYRGMGKTSVVEEAIRELNEESKKKSKEEYETIKISLSQGEVNDLDILRPIARQLFFCWEKQKKLSLSQIFFPVLSILILGIITYIVTRRYIRETPYILNYLNDWTNYLGSITSSSITHILTLLFFLLVISYFIILNLKIILKKLLNYDLTNKKIRYKTIFKQLSDLNNRLDAQTIREFQTNIGTQIKVGKDSSFSLGKLVDLTGSLTKNAKFQQNFQIATPKEIEKSLIDILSNIDKYRENKYHKNEKWIRVNPIPKFIIIIDELDKIEPNYIFNPNDNESTQRLLKADIGIFGGNNAKKRQIAIARILANLKSFLNVAKAKFLFIGGREMYDAFLADISDRDSFYSSIFNDVIYINSFFKDKVENGTGISKMTELYLCRLLLLGKNGKGTYRHLIDYYNYLIELYGTTEPVGESQESMSLKNGNIKKYVTQDQKLIIHKAIFLLQNFIIFLTYRSNGSPKKLADLVAEYIVREFSIRNKEENVIIENRNTTGEKLYLRFTFDSQYEIGLTSSLYRPYMIIHSRHLKSLGDKLLYSTTYILDYILKFHQQAFSWRNLELIPDIILGSKDPNVRYYLEDLMRFLSFMHIRETISGVFQFKYYSKVTSEIKHLSKISESSAAAFNFGLDESFQIKSYYKSKLLELQKSHGEFGIYDSDTAFIHSISFLQTILGDLHYYDKEYDDAIIYYTDSIQPIRNTKSHAKITNHQSVLFVRNKLKLGLCLEKIRAFDSAYSIYRSLILRIPDIIGQKIEESKQDEWEPPYIRMQLFIKPFVALLGLIEKQRMDGITYANLRRNRIELDIFLGSDTAKYLQIEPDPNIDEAEQETPPKQVNPSKKLMDWRRLCALNFDYFNGVGGFLFYKNRNFPWLFNSEAVPIKDKKESNPIYKRTEPLIFEDFKHKKDLFDFIAFMNPKDEEPSNIPNSHDITCDYTPSISAYIYYRWALRELFKIYKDNVDKFCKKGEKNEFVKAIYLLQPELSNLINSTNLYMFGNLFTKLGDTVLSMISRASIGILEKEVLDIYVLDDSMSANNSNQSVISNIKAWINKKDKNEKDIYRYDINLALILYRIAGLFYAKGNRTYSYAFQYKKFLYLVKDYITFFGKEDDKKDCIQAIKMEDLQKIAEKIFRLQTWIVGVSNRPQVIKYREIFQQSYISTELYEENPNLDTSLIYNNLSTNSEVREVVLLIEETRLKLYKHNLRFEGNMPPSGKLQSLLTPYDTISSMFTRILELKYKSEYNHYLFYHGHALYRGLATNYRKFINSEQLKEYAERMEWRDFEEITEITKDALFCLFEVIRILNLYGISYTTNHSFLANAHYKLANWCDIYLNLEALEKPLEEAQQKKELKRRVLELKSEYELKLNKQMAIELNEQMEIEKKTIKENLANELKVLYHNKFSEEIEKLSQALEVEKNKQLKHLLQEEEDRLMQEELKTIENVKKNSINNQIDAAISKEIKAIKKNKSLDKKTIESKIAEVKATSENRKKEELNKALSKVSEELNKEVQNKVSKKIKSFDKKVNTELSSKFKEEFQSKEKKLTNSIQKELQEKELNELSIRLKAKEEEISIQLQTKMNQELEVQLCKDHEMIRQEILNRKPTHKSIRDQVKEILGSETYNYLESNYHNEMAIQQYYFSIQTHREGKAYRDQLNSLSFSEDDFNDNLLHFSAANERLRVNTGVIRKKIQELKKKVDKSWLNQYGYYVNDSQLIMPDDPQVQNFFQVDR